MLGLAGLANADEAEDLYRQAIQILGGNANVVHKWNQPIRFVSVGDAGSAEVARRTVSAPFRQSS